MADIGHNSGSLSATAEANVETGIWLLCKEFLVTAIQDRRLERGHLRVLACFAQLMNRTTGKAWPDRMTIAAMAGMRPHAVSTAMGELKRYGYLVCDREPVPMAGGKTLVVYTFGNIDHDTIRAEITAFVEQLKLRRDNEKSPYTGNSRSPQTGKFPVQGEQKYPPTGNIPADGEQSSPQTEKSSSPYTGTSNSIEDNNNYPTKKTTIGRGSRLAADWKLPKSWGDWALATFHVTAVDVRQVAASFRDYWHAAPGSKGVKADWEATWRNWCRKSNWRYKPGAESDDDLLAKAEHPLTVDDLYSGWREQQK